MRLHFTVFASLLLMASQQWSLVCGGDIMLNQVPFKGNPLGAIAPILQSANLAIANLESPLTTKKIPTKRKTAAELKTRTQFLLKGDPRFAKLLAADGIRLVGTANNHCMDYGGSGLAEEYSALDTAKIQHAGSGANASASATTAVFTLPSGKRVGLFCALAFIGAPALRKCTPATLTEPGVNVLSFGGKIDDKARAKLAAIVAGAKQSCDFLIIGLHWGIERQQLPTPYQVQLGRAFIDAGADMVWGHHPHVLEGTEIYHGKPILYSMGNLVSPMPAETALVKLKFDGSKLTKMETIPCLVSGGKVKPNPKGRQTLKGLSELFAKHYQNTKGTPTKAQRRS